MLPLPQGAMMSERTLHTTDIVGLNPAFLFRWEEPQQAYVLLYPEGMVKFNGTASEILNAVAGSEGVAVGDIVRRLTAAYDNPDIAEDIVTFLEAAHERGWIHTKG